MNKKSLRAQIELNNVLLPVLVVFSILICGFYMIYNDLLVILYIGIFLFTPVIYFIAYYFIENTFLYFLVHIISFILVIFFSPTNDYRFVFIILSIIFIGISIYKRRDVVLPKPSSFGYFPTVAIIISFYIAKQLSTIYISLAITFIFITYVVLCMYNKYLVDSYIFCSTTAEECIPAFLKSKVIFKRLWRIFIFVTLLVMCGTSFIPTTGIVFNLSKVLKNLLGNILPNISTKDGSSGSTISASKTTIAPAASAKPIVHTTPKTLDMTYIYIIIISLAILFIIILIVCLFVSTNNIERVKDDETTFINPFNDDGISVPKKKKKFSAIFGNSNDQRIRKLFYKIITENIDERLIAKGSLTTEQLCNITYEKVDRDTLFKMKIIYDKARYSEDSCTHKDLSKMKELAKKCEYNTKEAYKEK